MRLTFGHFLINEGNPSLDGTPMRTKYNVRKKGQNVLNKIKNIDF